jgi:dihydroxyacetone kinase-like predicted kinase
LHIPHDQVVDGVKVLEKAGVVDSGAQGFVYMVDGMLLAAKGELPEAADPKLFMAGGIANDDAEMPAVDHTVTDSAFQFCTEAVVLLKEGVDKQTVLSTVTAAAEGGAASVAPLLAAVLTEIYLCNVCYSQ